MVANYHTHTFRCGHATGTDREYVEQAIMNGIKVLGFSEHCPWIFEDGFVSSKRILPGQVDEYYSSIIDLKKEYSSDITIYIGFESEYIPELMEKQKNLLAKFSFDYMILGEHFTGPENEAVYVAIENSDRELLVKYIDLIIQGMETGLYKYVAHPDLCNFVGDDDFYVEQYTRLCTWLKNNNYPIEINMVGVRDHEYYPSKKFLEIASKVGNTAIIGCDAHFPEALNDKDSIRKCILLAEKYNLRLISYLPDLYP